MKINILNILLYAAVFVILIFLMIVYKQNYLLFLLFPYVLLPAVTIPFFLRSIIRIKFTVDAATAYVESGNTVNFKFLFDNPTFCPILRCKTEFTAENAFYPNKDEHILESFIYPKKKTEIKIPVETSKVGMVSILVSQIKFHDLLGFVSIVKEINTRCEVPVLPCSVTGIKVPATPSGDGPDEYSEPDLRGNLSSDVKEIREYRPGDRLQRIHWKLSAKLDDLFVKEMDRTSVLSLVVLPEMTSDKIDDTVKTLKAIIDELCKREERFEVCLYNNTTCEFKYIVIDGEETVFDCYVNLFYLPLYDTPGLAREAYYASGQKNGAVIGVCGTDINLYSEGTLIV